MGLFRHNEQTSLRLHKFESGLLQYLRFYFDVSQVKQVKWAADVVFLPVGIVRC